VTATTTEARPAAASAPAYVPADWSKEAYASGEGAIVVLPRDGERLVANPV
jgi:hypothetical protein